MRTYDISLTINESLPIWPGDDPIQIETTHKLEDGAIANMTHISMGVHTGTHVDAPYHFLGGETPTVESLDLQVLNGRAYVLHVPDEVNIITADVLSNSNIPPRTRRLLFRTKNSELWENPNHTFQEDFVALDASAAQYLVEKNIKLVVIDYLSIASFHEPTPTHEILLKANVIIIEGLSLSKVSQGRYTIHCLPIKIEGVDGAPARVILVGV
jgi:arylformamidase